MGDEAKKILIVDDEMDHILMTSMCLKGAGYTVESVGDGETCLEKAPVFKPNLILLDIVLPTMDGWEVCDKLKSSPLTKDIAIIFLTAHMRNNLALQKNQHQDCDLMMKPIDVEKLLEKIREKICR